MAAVISSEAVRELRERSGAGMMDCKRALEETSGDIEAAMDHLRAKGLAKAAKKADRAAAEGVVAVATSGTQGVLIELNSETDFVARNERFQVAATALSQTALTVQGDLTALQQASIDGTTVTEYVTALAATVGENVRLRRATGLAVSQGLVASYMHNQIATGLGKIGVLLALETKLDAATVAEFGKQVAMHIAASSPLAMTPEEIDNSVIEREKAVLTEKAAASGKPAEIIQKIVESGLKSYFKDVCLPNQPFVLDPSKTVAEAVQAKAKELGGDIAIKGFVCFRLGEGVEKVQTDFAAEVAAAVNG